MEPKVFCIGFHKTGTTSLAVALKILGYQVTGPNGVRDPNIAANVHNMIDKLTKKYDAFQDNPWPVMYRELDRKYPDSKFILTVRDSSAWIRSQVKHFGYKETPMRKWIYGAGCPKGNEELYINRYERHNEEVMAYFIDRPEDLIIMDLAKGDGWNELCVFLDKPVPDMSFPHANQGNDRENSKTVVVRPIKKAKEAIGIPAL